ncbi:serine/threonine-protein kinase [Streptomyces sp. NPDC059445]|uniref:serine/threonine-protein kinase n=1 Tax=Streptomyces sp. NPDC059445 TaxID=3346832 RepID=UPI003687B59E
MPSYLVVRSVERPRTMAYAPTRTTVTGNPAPCGYLLAAARRPRLARGIRPSMRWEREMRLRESARAVASRCSADILNGRYRLDGLLGSGGAADVHRGFDLRLRRPVAVKVFRPETGFDTEETSQGEAAILARLHHPGLVTAFDAGQHDGRVFLVMQLVEGTTLRRRITAGPLTFEDTAALGSGVAHALAHAHEESVVHRDVKPSNILLDASHRPYLTDFGISRLLDATTQTATGTLIGTAAYLAPEQVLGQPVGRPADIYALGLVLLECLTGRLEYDGAPLEAAIARLHRQPALPRHLPPQLADLVRAMTALDENDRPTADDCARALAESTETGQLAVNPLHHAESSVISPTRSRTGDRTHGNPPPGGRVQVAARTRAVRKGPLAVGVGVALAAALVTALGVSGNSTSHGDDRSGTGITGVPDAGRKKQTTAPAGKVPSERTGTGRPADGAPGRSDGHASAGSVHASGVGAAPDSSAASVPARSSKAGLPGAAAHGAAKSEARRPPGQAEKATRKVKGKVR